MVLLAEDDRPVERTQPSPRSPPRKLLFAEEDKALERTQPSPPRKRFLIQHGQQRVARRLDAQHVRDVYELYGDDFELKRDGRPNQDFIWKNF